MKLLIDRLRWARGGNNGNAALLNEDGNMCCLGFLAIEMGLTRDDIDGVGDFSDDFGGKSEERGIVDIVKNDPAKFAAVCTVETECGETDEYEYISPTDFHGHATQLNDASVREVGVEVAKYSPAQGPIINSEARREEKLIELFAKEDIQLEFTN